MIILSRRAAAALSSALLSAIGGAIVAVHYHRLGLTLSHYDARGHLVVARRIADSITPGWQQIGALWLPLPHLVNAIPVQIDALYRNGASAVVISVASFAVATGAIVWIVSGLTESIIAGLTGAVVLALNPNVLYLQATPLTEPLLLALALAAMALLIAWCEDGRDDPLTRRLAGGLLALACLTRYEAWPATAGALGLAGWARWRRGETLAAAGPRLARVAAYPACAALGFLAFSRVVVGQWFVSSGFFVPENKALGDPLLAAAEIWWGVRALSGPLTIAIAGAGLLGIALRGVTRRERAADLITISLIAMTTVPWAAFVGGHPFRVRYTVPLVAMEAIGAGGAVGLLNLFGPLRTFPRILSALLLLSAVVSELRPLDAAAPMIVEAQWDRPNASARQGVTRCLRSGYDGDTIMASMGSLGHYMQEAAGDGFAIRDFLHEGNGDIWLAALDGPRPFVGWVLIEEKANGGDMLAIMARENPHFLDGFSRVCEGAGLALYRREKLRMKN